MTKFLCNELVTATLSTIPTGIGVYSFTLFVRAYWSWEEMMHAPRSSFWDEVGYGRAFLATVLLLCGIVWSVMSWWRLLVVSQKGGAERQKGDATL